MIYMHYLKKILGFACCRMPPWAPSPHPTLVGYTITTHIAPLGPVSHCLIPEKKTCEILESDCILRQLHFTAARPFLEATNYKLSQFAHILCTNICHVGHLWLTIAYLLSICLLSFRIIAIFWHDRHFCHIKNYPWSCRSGNQAKMQCGDSARSNMKT